MMIKLWFMLLYFCLGSTCGYTKLKVWYKNPKYPRLKFSNEQLPHIYKAAYNIRGGFEDYFREQIDQWWKRKQRFTNLENRMAFLSGE